MHRMCLCVCACVDQDTYDIIQNIPIANKIGIHSRQELVRRLEGYQLQDSETLRRAVKVIERHFLPAIKRHAISGTVTVRM